VSEIHGHVAPGFGAVRDAFENNFERHGDIGAACTVYRGEEVVVDLWGGLADPTTSRAWRRDTLQIVFSATKGVTAVCVNWLVERGKLDLDAVVSSYWPEFGARGKEGISLRWVLSHRAGVPVVDSELTLDEVLAWDPVISAIANQAPCWEPGTEHGYHVRSFGWILGEVIRRVTGKSPGRFFADEIAGPLALDFFIGLPEHELSRCARLLPPVGGMPDLGKLLGEDSLTVRALGGPSGLFAYDEMWNRPELLIAEMPSSNGVGTARALARMYAACIGEIDGCRLLSSETVEKASTVHSDGADKVIIAPMRFGLGFTLPPTLAPGCGVKSFGHPGAGGSLGFADPEARIGFGYVPNQMQFEPRGDARTIGLVEATYGCL
jgi:CubicO group peptidase (beta-lactamase class C family)